MYQSRYNSLCILKYVSIQKQLSQTLSSLPNNGRSKNNFIDTQSFRTLYSLLSKLYISDRNKKVVDFQLFYILGLIVQVKCIDWQVCSEVNEHSYQYKRHSTSLVGCGRIHLWTLILPFLPVVTLHYVFWRQRGQGLSYYNPLGVLGLPYWGTFRFNSLSYL